MALQVNGRTRRRSRNDCDQAGADGLPDGNTEVQRENRRQQNSAANAGERAEESGDRNRELPEGRSP